MTEDMLTVRVKYVTNKGTGTLHRKVVSPDNGQVLSGERCNQDQILESDAAPSMHQATYKRQCKWCFQQ